MRAFKATCLAIGALATAAGAQPCDDACRLQHLYAYGVIATRTMRTLPGPMFQDGVQGVALANTLCTNRAALATTQAADIVATARTGAAVRWRMPPPRLQYYDFYNNAYGDIVTGGGRVVGPYDAGSPDDYAVDTTGTNPAVAECLEAMTDASALSDDLAGAAPTQVFGDIEVAANQESEITIHPNDVVQINRLVLHDAALSRQPHGKGYYERVCAEYGAYFSIAGSGPAIINVDELQIGACSTVFVDDYTLVLNVPGRGHRVSFGVGSTIPMPVLAPERSLIFYGTSDDSGTGATNVWAKQIVMTGYTYAGY